MKYRYAYNEQRQVVSIDDVRNRAGRYTCVSCGERIVPRLGPKNVHHFSHLATDRNFPKTMRICSPEHYVHLIAKKLFLNAYSSDEPFLLKWNAKHTCTNINAHKGCSKTKYNTINLISKYPCIEVEKRDGDFIPDILLSNASGEKIYIEFAYSHLSSQKKLLSGQRIVEIGIDTEADIERIMEARSIVAAQKNVEFYGFEKEHFDCGGKCIDPKPSKAHLPSNKPKQKENYKDTNIIIESRESYYKVRDFKFLIKMKTTTHQCPMGFERYKGVIPTLEEIEHEVYFNKQLIGVCPDYDGAIEIAEDYAKRHTQPTLF